MRLLNISSLGKALAVALSAILCVPRASAKSTDPVLTAADLQADVTVIERVYRELHPGLMRYLTASQLKAAIFDLRRQLQTPQSTSSAYLAFARFAAKVRCGHTYANFFNQPREIQAIFESTPRLPFYFRWLDGKMIVTKDLTEAHLLPAGTEVFSVNGVSSGVILQRLLPLARADGSNDAKRIDQLAITGDSVYEAFDIYYPMVFKNLSHSFSLAVSEPEASGRNEVIVRALTYAQSIAPIADREKERRGGSQPLFEWRDLESGAAYLRMPTWALFESKWDWRSWLNSRLDELAARGAPALIVDLRGNEGGLDVGDLILSRLIEADLVLADARRLVRYRAVPAALLPYLKTWDKSFEDWGNEASELVTPWPTAPQVHYLSLAPEEKAADGRHVIHPASRRYKGRVFVLVDASNSSATFQFAQVIQQQKLGTLVGQPTGGNLRGINGGAFFFVNMPHSKIEMDLPLIGYFPAAQEPDRGLEPEIETRPSRTDIAAGVDNEMTAVTRALGGNPAPH